MANKITYDDIDTDDTKPKKSKTYYGEVLKPEQVVAAEVNANLITGGRPGRVAYRIKDDDGKRDTLEKVIKNVQVFAKKGEQPVRDNAGIQNRADWYFSICAETAQIPTFEKFCITLGYTTSIIMDWMRQRNMPAWVNSDTLVLLSTYLEQFKAIDADLVVDGKMDKVAYLFRAKNYYNMRDDPKLLQQNQSKKKMSEQELFDRVMKLDASKSQNATLVSGKKKRKPTKTETGQTETEQAETSRSDSGQPDQVEVVDGEVLPNLFGRDE